MEEEISFFERPAVRALIVFGLMVIAYVVLGYYFTWEREGQLRREKERKSAAVGYEVELTPEEKNNLTADSFRREFESEAWDIALLTSGLILWTVLFSQFILPVRKIRDRFGILDRMMAYFTGFHGPAIFVENGNIRSRQDETQKHGPGVIWLDHASAAVLRTATRFTRTISPGVHFTSRDEYIAATVDLHILTHTIGPNDHENPFTVAKDDENYQRIQDSGLETRAMTRDGIILVAPIAVTFKIASEKQESETIYGYHPENVAKVVTESLVQGAKIDQPIWSPMPAKMAADIWREYVSRFRLNELFEAPAGESKTNLQLIAGLLKDRMSMDNVRDMDEFGNFTGRTIHSLEAQKLKEMGIQVMGVNLKRIIMPPDIEERLVNKWTTMWEKNAKKEQEQIEQDRRIREEKGQMDAQIEFANIITSELQTMTPCNKRHAVYLFTHSTSQSVIRNLGLMKKMSKSDTSALTEIARWLKGNQ